jgi:hypothetical protein
MQRADGRAVLDLANELNVVEEEDGASALARDSRTDLREEIGQVASTTRGRTLAQPSQCRARLRVDRRRDRGPAERAL